MGDKLLAEFLRANPSHGLGMGWGQNPEDLDEAMELAKKAISLDDVAK